MKNKLISMVDFVKFINSLTTTELIKEFPNHFTEYRPSLHKDMVRYLLSIDAIKWKITKEFMQFLNTPLNISMFVPAIEVDGKWEVLEMPGGNSHDIYGQPIYDNYVSIQEYQQAKDRVLFEGFEVKIGVVTDYATFNHSRGRTKIMLNNKTINDLIKYAPTLTTKGLEVSGLNNK